MISCVQTSNTFNRYYSAICSICNILNHAGSENYQVQCIICCIRGLLIVTVTDILMQRFNNTVDDFVFDAE